MKLCGNSISRKRIIHSWDSEGVVYACYVFAISCFLVVFLIHPSKLLFVVYVQR